MIWPLKRKRKFAELETTLGYRFKNQDLLLRALTHASTRASTRANGSRNDNERLEFLGDRVLGLVMAERLLEAFPEASEGDLAKRFNRLVRGETCAVVGQAIGIGQHLVLSESEAGSGGRAKATILADAVEALLGAVFLDSGFDKARTVVLKLWQDRMTDMPQVAADPKSALQEWAQGKGLELPRYVEVSRTGPDHAPHFIAEVRIDGCKPARGEGTSKRSAEQSAASALLAREGVIEARKHDA